MSLITAPEVVRFSPVNRDYPKNSLCDIIRQVEESFFYDCLGEDFKDYLEAHLSTTETIPNWSSGESYSVGDMVKMWDCYYISIENGNCSEPDEEDSGWEPLEKFDNECSNNLWTGYLARILALKVYKESLVFSTFSATAGGLTVREESNGTRSANAKEIDLTRTEVLSQIETTTQNMLRWIKKQTACDFPALPECENNCDVPNSSGRKWGLNTYNRWNAGY